MYLKFLNLHQFAVAFNRRGVEETEMKQKGSVHDCHESPLLDKNECLRVVASAVKDTVPDSVVDLKSPQVLMLIFFLSADSPFSRVCFNST